VHEDIPGLLPVGLIRIRNQSTEYGFHFFIVKFISVGFLYFDRHDIVVMSKEFAIDNIYIVEIDDMNWVVD
jgi:hypothetical protein